MIEPTILPDTARWYVVSCTVGYERRTRRNLQQHIDSMGMAGVIHEVRIPVEMETEIRSGIRTSVERIIYPGYLLVHMEELRQDDSSNRAWFVVRNTPGVTSFCGDGTRPIPLTPDEAARMLRQTEAEAPVIAPRYRRGENVRIIDGPFSELIGIVAAVTAERLKVFVEFFGRETPVELDFLQVEKLEP